eukprot:TRINITY_DN24189_c0_g1_i1.p1 TRINITY_DN24189_c0_g1~~TRINITY_DN24189_c0_g1_i1.p1  ORF type:complete len:583 (+),score=109.33 TRINITY_DN24189_c0_g1_i1:398-2146(+)
MKSLPGSWRLSSTLSLCRSERPGRCDVLRCAGRASLWQAEERESWEALVASELKCMACGLQQSSQRNMLCLAMCEHQVCKQCVSNCVTVHMEKHTALSCPVQHCISAMSQTDVRTCCSPELFDEYTHSTLTRAIEESDGFVKCPKCSNVVEVLPGAGGEVDGEGETETAGRVTSVDGTALNPEAQQHAQRHRFRCRCCDTIFCSSCGRVPYHVGFTCDQFNSWASGLKCVYCQGVWEGEKLHPTIGHTSQNIGQIRSSLLKWHKLCCRSWKMDKKSVVSRAAHILESVCQEDECRQHAAQGCLVVKSCGHMCGGVVGEEDCLPCLHQNCLTPSIDQSREDFCNVCWVAELGSAPCLQLGCGHLFHAACLRGQLQKGSTAARLTFGHLGCPLCKQTMCHPWLTDLLEPGIAMLKAVQDKALVRLEFEKLLNDPQIETGFNGDKLQFALKKFAYYSCHKCKEPYFGGHRNCEDVEDNREFDPTELVCSRCSAINGAECAEHGAEYIEWKCKFCCSIASWFCWGNTHFCDDCHKKQGTAAAMTKKKKEHLPICPGACSCPLRVDHPAAGNEFCLGCGICRNSLTW